MKTTTILQAIIQEIQTDPSIRDRDSNMVIMRELCKKIQAEEDEKITEEALSYMKEHGPQGASVFLTLWIPFQKHPKETSYITLEHDALEDWSVCYYVDFGKSGRNKLRKRHEIGYTKPNQILTKFAKIYKEYLGE